MAQSCVDCPWGDCLSRCHTSIHRHRRTSASAFDKSMLARFAAAQYWPPLYHGSPFMLCVSDSLVPLYQSALLSFYFPLS